MEPPPTTNLCPSHPTEQREYLCQICKTFFCSICCKNEKSHKEQIIMISKELLSGFEFKEYLGTGTMGCVFNVISLGERVPYALRVINDIKTQQDFEMVSHQTEIHAKMSHPNIIKYFSSFLLKTENLFVILLELADSSLKSEIHTLSQEVALFYFAQILEALRYLHEDLRIAHRNLKLRNILLKQGVVKLCHMGEANGRGFGTDIYLPPEVLNGGKYNEKSDIWSAGIVFHYMLSKGRHPFDLKGDRNQNKIVENVKKMQLKFDDSIKEAKFLEILKNCLQFDETARFSASQLLELIKKAEEPKKPHADNKIPEENKEMFGSKNVIRGKPLLMTFFHTKCVNSVTFSPDNQTLASGSNDKTIKLWDIKTGKLLMTLEGHTDSVWSVSISPDNKTLASGSWDKTIKLWEIKTGKLLKTLEGHTDDINSVSISPENQILASGSDDKTIRIWEIKTGKLLKTLKGHTDDVNSVSISPDNQILASGSRDTTIKLWDVKNGKLLKTLEGHTNYVYSVSISPDSQTLASGSADSTIKLWDFKGGKLLQTLLGHANSVNSVAISPDNLLLASGSVDWTIKLWDIHSRKLLKSLDTRSITVFSVSFSPDNQTLASGSSDYTVKLWKI